MEKYKNSIRTKVYSILTGLSTGFINGMFGGGGGMIVVPMLTSILDFSQKNAHATAILIILPLSLLSGALYSSFGVFDISVGIPVGIGVLVGGIIGAFLLSKLSSKILIIIFSIIMIGAGVRLLAF